MTTREKLFKMLTDNGVLDSQAEAIMKLATPEIEKLVPDYHITWDRPAEEYPDTMYALWYMTMKPIAFDWLDKNCPKAWFNPVFAP